MTVLVPMPREAFAAFAAESNEAYAPDHSFYEVHDASGTSVGAVWFGIVGVGEAKAGYVYNIRIRPDQQRKGYAKAALLELEALAAHIRLPALRLNVFGHNPGAEALYRSLGYKVTSSS